MSSALNIKQNGTWDLQLYESLWSQKIESDDTNFMQLYYFESTVSSQHTAFCCKFA